MPNIASPSDPVDIAPQYSGGSYSTPDLSGGSAAPASGGGGMGISGVIGDVGSAVGDFMAAGSARQSASEYEAAAAAAISNENVVKGSLVTQTAQMQRQYQMTLGAQTAEIGAAGFNAGHFVNGTGTVGSGSGLYLQRASGSQFNLNLSTMTGNNYLQQQAYEQQAQADKALAQQARSKAAGLTVGGIFSGISAVAGIAQMAAA